MKLKLFFYFSGLKDGPSLFKIKLLLIKFVWFEEDVSSVLKFFSFDLLDFTGLFDFEFFTRIFYIESVLLLQRLFYIFFSSASV